MIYTNNLQPSPYDSRDYQVCALSSLPDVASVEHYIHNVEQQGYINSCTANALAAATEIALKRNQTPRDASRLFLYYYARHAAGKQLVDGGSNIRLAFDQLAKRGVCDESVWPYDPSAVFYEPSVQAQTIAKQFRCTRYESCGTGTDQALRNIKTCIAQGYPVVIGMNITSQLFDLRAGEVYVGTGYAAGGHAMLVVGYSPDGFTVLNSWGETWNSNGKFLLLENIARREIFDAWVAKEYTGIAYVPPYPPPDPTIRIYLDGGETFRIGQSAKIFGGQVKGSVILLPTAHRVWMDGNIDRVEVPWQEVAQLDYMQTGNVLHIWHEGLELGRIALNGPATMAGSDNEWPIEFDGTIRIGGCRVNQAGPTRLE